MWKDASGAIAPIIAWDAFSKVLFADAQGIVWGYDLFRREVNPGVFVGGATTSNPLYFTTTNCTGTVYYYAYPPRITFLGLTGEMRVIKDAAAVGSIVTGSWLSSNGCQTANPTFSMYAVVQSDTNTVTVPSTPPFTMPIRPEYAP